jgi:hypothetical protein
VITNISSINKEAFDFGIYSVPNGGRFSIEMPDAKPTKLKILDAHGRVIQIINSS